MKIGFATTDWSIDWRDDNGNPTLGGAGHYRVGVPAAALAKHAGVEVVVGHAAMLSSGVLGIREHAPGEPKPSPLAEFGLATPDDAPKLTGPLHTDCDVIVMQRYMNFDMPDCIRKARANGQRVVNDMDDWFFGLDSRNGAQKATNPHANPERNRIHYAKTLRASDLVTCSTTSLAALLREQLGIDAVVVRNAIDLNRWQMREPRDQPLTVGWIGVTSHRSGDLETLAGMIGPWLVDHEARWYQGGHRIGTRAAFDLAAIDPNMVECDWIPMVGIDAYPGLFPRLDIGLVPLNDVSFNHAKSAIKGLEYAAAGVPFIAQALPSYLEVHGESGLGWPVASRRDWLDALDQMAVSAEFRAEIAARNRSIVEARYSIEDRWIDWLIAYSAI